jgi:hypothetical protein
MAKRPDTLETVLLAIELLNRIPRGRKVTASELHTQLKDAGLERDLRTIHRHWLRELGGLSDALWSHWYERPCALGSARARRQTRTRYSKLLKIQIV